MKKTGTAPDAIAQQRLHPAPIYLRLQLPTYRQGSDVSVMSRLRERSPLEKERQLTYLYVYKNLRSIISNERLTISMYRNISDCLSVRIGHARF